MLNKCCLWAATLILLSRWTFGVERLKIASDASEPVAEQVAALIEQLDAPGFGERQAASQQLEDIGATVISPLELAVKTGSREAAGRALDILRRHFEQGPPKVPAYAEPGMNVGFNRVPNLQVVIGGGGRSITLSDVNGRRSMEITDPRRQVTLHTLPGGNIDVQITEKNGKNATQRMTAKDVDELKRKDAEIGRLYEIVSRMTPVPRPAR